MIARHTLRVLRAHFTLWDAFARTRQYVESLATQKYPTLIGPDRAEKVGEQRIDETTT
jgi:hypothetical protein